MTKPEENLWQGIDASARDDLNTRDYRTASFAEGLSQRDLEASEFVGADRNKRDVKEAWIPGVEIFARKIHAQRHRGLFAEFVRRDEGILARICLWPKQWSAARMFANTAKGFHVHPPSIPKGGVAADWLRGVFIDERENYSLRRYDDEQWDVMFFLQGRVEIILCDIRAGFPRRVMRFFVVGDNHRALRLYWVFISGRIGIHFEEIILGKSRANLLCPVPHCNRGVLSGVYRLLRA